ncbi:glycosyltransferase [Candidatus Mesenet endosymbiont of Phosphuga atrata]|uniref:glycosyltransferase n=1 Tax=Candidatus Mesenet endosymbiont of Phosphuga atrata TaxID=3066221 RepID=UPI0030CDED71
MLNILSIAILLLTTDITILKNNDHVVSDNLPIYFVWLGSDIPPKFFNNLKRTTDTNKTRDVILVYSKKYLPKNNRKNIDSIKAISIDDIKARIELVRNDNTENLWKTDVYDMELDKQYERIYNLLDQIFTANFFDYGERTRRYCLAADLMKLPLINIIGGIYFDIDTEVIGAIGDIKSKKGFNIYYYNDNAHALGNFFAKTNRKNSYFDKLMKEFLINKVEGIITGKLDIAVDSDPVDHIRIRILQSYMIDYMNSYLIWEFLMQTKLVWHAKQKEDHIEWEMRGEIPSERLHSKIYKPMISDYGVEVPPTVKLRMKHGDRYDINYNDPEQLRKLTNLP